MSMLFSTISLEIQSFLFLSPRHKFQVAILIIFVFCQRSHFHFSFIPVLLLQKHIYSLNFFFLFNHFCGSLIGQTQIVTSTILLLEPKTAHNNLQTVLHQSCFVAYMIKLLLVFVMCASLLLDLQSLHYRDLWLTLLTVWSCLDTCGFSIFHFLTTKILDDPQKFLHPAPPIAGFFLGQNWCDELLQCNVFFRKSNDFFQQWHCNFFFYLLTNRFSRRILKAPPLKSNQGVVA